MNRNRGEGGLMTLLIVYDRGIEVEGMEAHPPYYYLLRLLADLLLLRFSPPLLLQLLPLLLILSQTEPLEHCY